MWEIGPSLGRPHADTVEESKHKNMKKLRIQHKNMFIDYFLYLTRNVRLYYLLVATNVEIKGFIKG